MKPTLYTCYETGRIFEQRYRYPAAFCVARKYELIYKENLPRFSCPRQIYALPFGEKPFKVYLGTDREGEDEYSRGIRSDLTNGERALLKRMRRMREQDGEFYLFLSSEADAELFHGMLEATDEYELVHARCAGSDEPYPEDYELLKLCGRLAAFAGKNERIPGIGSALARSPFPSRAGGFRVMLRSFS